MKRATNDSAIIAAKNRKAVKKITGGLPVKK